MKRLSIMTCAWALLALATVLSMSSCGGGSIKAIVPPEVDIHPTPSVTLDEVLSAKFGPAFQGMFQAYDGAKTDYLRVTWLDPTSTELTKGSNALFGVDQVYAKVFDIPSQTYVEKPITSYPQVVSTLAGFGRMTNEDDLYEVLGFDFYTEGADQPMTTTNHSVVTVGWSADEWTNLWDAISGGVLAGIVRDFGVTVLTKDGYVEFRKADQTLSVVLGAVWVGRALVAAAATGCPEEKKRWDWTLKVGPPPADNRPPVLSPSGPTELEVDETGTWAANATDPDGDILQYRWTIDGLMVGTDANYSHAFDAEGTYRVAVDVTDGYDIVSYYWDVVVTETPPARVLDRVTISPAMSTVAAGATQQFSAAGYDQYNEPLAGVSFTWSVANATAGTINQNGLFTAGSTAGQYTGAIQVTGTYQGASKSATATVTVTTTPPPTGQTLVAFPGSSELEVGESQEFQLWLKDVQTGSLIRQLDNSTELDSWTISPAVEGEGYVVATKGLVKTWQDSGPPDYIVQTYATPDTYTVTATYGELSVTIPVTIKFASGG